jgi:DNA-binding transcriptional regulator YhcF (GntR family)
MHEFNNDKPIYLQLKDIIEQAILTDKLKPDEAIPSIRVLAKDYQLNPITVTNTIDELVASGVLYKKRGIGMYVAENAKHTIKEQQAKSFKNKDLVSAVERARMLGISRKEIDKIINNIYGG